MQRIFLVFLIILFSVSSEHNSLTAVTDPKRIIVRDSFNREVSIPADIKRIGCLYAFSGHVVAMLGRGDSIVAVVRGLQRDKMLTKICPAILEAAVPNLNDSLNMEELARVKPDVVFIKDTVARKKSDTDTLTKLGIPYVVISFNNIEGQKKAVEIIGKAIGREKEAGEYISYYNKCSEKVKKIASRIPENKKIRLYHSLLEPLKTDGHRGISTEWMGIAGVINVSAEDQNSFSKEEFFANIEQVLVWNPQVIITHEEDAEETIIMSKSWSTIDAVKNGRVYRMPNGISRWGHPGSLETPLAMLWTVKTIYPDYAKEIDLKKETVNFYKNFFNYTLSDNMTDQILQGRGMRKSKKQGGH